MEWIVAYVEDIFGMLNLCRGNSTVSDINSAFFLHVCLNEYVVFRC